MKYTNEDLEVLFDKTDGRCHCCHKKLCFPNYGRPGTRGAWEMDHSRARKLGGSNHFNNLFPACIRCNRTKSTKSSRTMRAQVGKRMAPMSAKRERDARRGRALSAGGAGGIVGLALGGPAGALFVGILGGLAGYNSDLYER